MALVVSVKSQRNLSGDSSRARGERTASIPYTISCNEPPASQFELEEAAFTAGLPAVGNELPGDPSRIVNKVTFTAGGTHLEWSAKVEYAPAEATQWDENPLLRPDTVSFSGTKEQEAVFLTADDEQAPIVTSAGEVFSTLPQRTTGAFKMVIEGNRETFDAALFASYLKPNAVNLDAFTVRGITVGEGLGKMVSIDAGPQQENGFNFYRIKWEVELAPTWDLLIEDRGFVELFEDELFPIVTGNPPDLVKKPWPLDGAGNAQANADDAPAILEFPVQPSLPFSVFNWSAGA